MVLQGHHQDAPNNNVIKTKAKAKKSGAPLSVKVITYGSDFSGLSSQSLVLKALTEKWGLKVNFEHKFACDNMKACKKLINHIKPPMKFYDDITNRIHEEVPEVDFYQYTAPCQGISGFGRQDPNDPRTAIVSYAILQVRKRRPKCFVSEQVAGFGQGGKFKALHDWVVSEHVSDGHDIHEQIVNTGDYGVPHHRLRYYMVGIRKDIKRARTGEIAIFPNGQHFPTKLPFNFIAPRLPDGEWKAHPPAGTNAYNNVISAYGKCKVNPFMVPVVIDTGSSLNKFQDFRINSSPTLSATRASQRGYWCSTKGGHLDVHEMATLQGYMDILGTKVPFKEAGVTVSQFGHCLGNAQSANFLLVLYPRVLFHAQLITLEQYKAVMAALHLRLWNMNTAGTPTDNGSFPAYPQAFGLQGSSSSSGR